MDVPPIVAYSAVICTPSTLPIALLPVTSVPIKFPCTTLLVAPTFRISTPTLVFPEMMFRTAAVVPPIMLLAAPLITTPDALLTLVVPAELVPMKLPWIVALPTKTSMPLPLFPEIRFPAPLVIPPIVMLGALMRMPPAPFALAAAPVALVPR